MNITKNMINLFYFNINIFFQIDNFIKKHINKVSIKQNRIMCYKNKVDALLSLIAEIIVRQQCIEYLNCKNEDIKFKQNKYGKPYLSENNHLFFNISHTKDALVVAVSDKEIGIDIEKISLCNIDVSKRCFCKNEYDYILSDSVKSDIRFFGIWTKKEAYIKYLGVGLSKPLNSFSVLSDDFKKHSYNFRINSYIISLYSEYELIDYSKIKFTLLNESDIYFFAEQL